MLLAYQTSVLSRLFPHRSLGKGLLFLCLFLASFFLNSQSRWERVYQTFPNEKETAFGVLPTVDGGLFMLASSSQTQTGEELVYLVKTDADGAPLFSKTLATGRALKMKALPDSNIIVFYRKKAMTDSVEFRYALVSQTGTVLLDSGIDPSAVNASKKMWDFAPIHSGSPLVKGGFAVALREKFPINNTQLKIAFMRKDGVQQNAILLDTLLQADSVYIRSIIQAADSNFYAVGFVQKNDSLVTADADPLWFKVSYDGSVNMDSLYDEPDTIPAWQGYEMWHDIAQRPDGNFWVLSVQSSQLGPDFSTLVMIQMDNMGHIIRKDTVDDHISNLEFSGDDHSEIVVLPDGGAVLLYDKFTPNVNEEDIALTRIDADGQVLWTRYYGRGGRFGEAPFGIHALQNGGYVVCGVFKDLLFNSVQAYMFRTDSLGFVFTNYVEGQVYADLNGNCAYDASEPPLGGWVVAVERPGQTVFETLTDADGYYLVPTDTGQVSVRIQPPAGYWSPCQNVLSASMSTPFDTVSLGFGIKNIGECPQLEVDIATSFLRRCFKNSYSVAYANRGTKAVQNASVEIALDPDLNFYGASIPLTWSLGKLLHFNIGDLPIGAIGQFHIEVEVDCNSPLGATHCTTVHIFPDTTCTPQNWSGATIEVDGTCKGITNMLEFRIKNTGNQSNSTSVDYIIIEDHVIFKQGQIGNLPPDTDTTIRIVANGKTYRLETSQEPGSPGPSNPAVAVEGCGLDSTGMASTGYITIFPNDDGDPFSATECLENIGSFDPNDKTANPRGYEDEHFIFPNTPIDYKIRFQNTGTDTAFAVVIRDTLSPLLDLRTLVPGAASHPYQMSILDNRTLKFYFSNIMLPDSNVNEPYSHGFVQFSVRHVPTIPLGTRINNSAAIYFDFNEPVITNTYHLTVDTGFLEKVLVSNVQPYLSSMAAVTPVPNPMNSFSIVRLNASSSVAEGEDLFLEIYTTDGRLVQRLSPSGADYFKILRGTMQPGLYVLSLKVGRRALGFGRLVVE